MSFKEGLQSVLRIGSAHNKGGPPDINIAKFHIFRTLFELKLWFTFMYKHSKPEKCQIFI